MRKLNYLLFIGLISVGFSAKELRKGKVFSLFNVVTFDNEACTSTSVANGENRKGTCYTADECSNKGGAANGNCASGFGVCCVFIKTDSGSSSSQNCTYFKNEGGSTYTGSSGSKTYTVTKANCDVCRVRLDFEAFNILGPAGTNENVAANRACQDTFDVKTTSLDNYPTICGLNTGEHIYLDMSEDCSESATLTMNIGAAVSTTRAWDIKATQIDCAKNTDIPPEGCLQYFTSSTGKVRSFNFQNSGEIHLENQNYNVCFRQNSGFSCIEYLPCQDTLSYTLNPSATIPAAGAMKQPTFNAMFGPNCLPVDHITIEGGRAACCNTGGVSHNLFCGDLFRADVGKLTGTAFENAHLPICDCSAPFKLGIFTNAAQDPGNQRSRGLCLDYKQKTCP